MSPPPPAANGTTIVTARLGKSCARAGAQKAATTHAKTKFLIARCKAASPFFARFFRWSVSKATIQIRGRTVKSNLAGMARSEGDQCFRHERNSTPWNDRSDETWRPCFTRARWPGVANLTPAPLSLPAHRSDVWKTHRQANDGHCRRALA